MAGLGYFFVPLTMKKCSQIVFSKIVASATKLWYSIHPERELPVRYLIFE